MHGLGKSTNGGLNLEPYLLLLSAGEGAYQAGLVSISYLLSTLDSHAFGEG